MTTLNKQPSNTDRPPTATPAKLPAAARAAQNREARLARERAARATSETATRQAVAAELEAHLGTDWTGSLQTHRSRWLASLDGRPSPPEAAPATGVPLSPVTFALIVGSAPTVPAALDCAAGIAWWTTLVLQQCQTDSKTPQARESKALMERRAALFDSHSPAPPGVEPDLWPKLLATARRSAKRHGWLETDGSIGEFFAQLPQDHLPEAPILDGFLNDDAFIALEAADPDTFRRAARALASRIQEASLLSDALAERSAATFTARQDEAMLRRRGLISSGRPTALPRHLASWVLKQAGLSSYVIGLFLIHAGLLDLNKYVLDRPQLTRSRLTQAAKDTRKFWKKQAERTPPVHPVALLGDLEIGAWMEHQGRDLAARFEQQLRTRPDSAAAR
ncbi:MAG: hypothetical protein GY898_25085 [Proteobacteria bacterium]|nr:hypothetical protein [Pseudomonadota bacterium]